MTRPDVGDRGVCSIKRQKGLKAADRFLFAMMSTKLKPTWRHTTWSSTDYMVRTVAEPQKKLPVFKPGRWTINAQRKTALYGHDAKNMKNFTLHFENGV